LTGKTSPRIPRQTTPQAVLLTMVGRYCMETNPALATAAYIDVLSRIGITDHATRLTVSRMTERGLLERLRRGRTAYFRATAVALDVVRVQEARTFGESAQPCGPEDAWTILSFSLPEEHRKTRHLLRRRLAWEGFGLLRDGMWIAPGDRDLREVLGQPLFDGVDRFVTGFTAYPKVGDVQEMISRTWQLDQLSERYRQFLRDWDVAEPAPTASDALGRYLLLVTDWRQLVRETPRLPAAHLPEDWPADRCLTLFGTLHDAYAQRAEALFQEIVATHQWPDAPPPT
jgi:phenylacetic acid degradation operon negative regulatory protein